MAKLIYLTLAINVSMLNCAQEKRCSLFGCFKKVVRIFNKNAFETIEEKSARELKLAFVNAAKVGDLATVELCISKNVDVNTLDAEGYPALILAARFGHDSVVAALIQAQANIELRDKQHGSTALMFAAQNDHTKVVELLLKAGADIHAKSNGGNGATSLIFAAEKGHHQTMQFLIQAGANVNETTRWGTALYCAAIFGHESAVKVLLQNPKIDINNSGYKDCSVMHGACNGNNEIIVARLLAENGLDLGEFVVGARVIQYRNPVIRNLVKSKINNWHAQLFEAVRERKLARVRELLDKAKQVLFFNSDGDNLLHSVIKNIKDADPRESAAQGDADAIVLKLLISMKPELLQYDNKAGLTPIDLAVQKPQILKYLFDLAYGSKEFTSVAASTENTTSVVGFCC